MSSQVDALSSGGGTGERISDKVLPKMNDADGGSQITQVASGHGNHASNNQGGKSSSSIPVKPPQDGGVHMYQLDKEGSISSITPGKILQTPGRGSNGLHSGLEGRSPVIREKVSEDGYHWRKYGQKFVRGNEFIRSYYRCTHPTCQVKKQLECSQEGDIADIVYLGDHDHPKPQVNVPVAVGFVLSVVEERPEKPLQTTARENMAPPSVETLNSSQISSVTSSKDVKGVQLKSSKARDEVCNDNPVSKRQKKTNRNADPNPEDKPTGESRVVVQTLSEVDIVNDGYRWRKYGQKMVKGNPNPRSYYRCSCLGCPAKKHVERASHDPKMVVTSYEGQHDHDIPCSRTVMANPIGPGICPTGIQNGDSKTEVCPDLVVSDSLHLERKSQDQMDGKSGNKLTGNGVTSTGGILSTSGDENKPDGQQNGKSFDKEENEGAVVVSVSLVSAAKSEEKENGDLRAEPEESGAACSVHTITSNKQHMPSTG